MRAQRGTQIPGTKRSVNCWFQIFSHRDARKRNFHIPDFKFQILISEF